MTRCIAALAVAFAAGIGALPASAVQKYIATPLGTLDGPGSRGRSVNASGQVTGQASLFIGGGRAFLYSNGNMTDLGTLGGQVSDGFGINDNAEVTGLSTTAGDAAIHAFLYSGGTMMDLGVLVGGSQSFGRSINNNGQVAGYSYVGNAVRAFLYSGGTMQDIGTLGGTDSDAFGINSSGQVTGSSLLAGNLQRHAFIYSDGIMQDLGGMTARGYAINDSGQVAGSSYSVNGGFHAFLYSDGMMHDLGTLGATDSHGVGINNSGEVVGVVNSHFDPPDAFNGTPFLYTGGIMYNLASLVVSGLEDANLFSATSINDSGQIAAYGCVGKIIIVLCQAYRLDPVTMPNASQSWVYKPLPPCRIMDTRNATPESGVQGPLAGATLYQLPGYTHAGLDWSAYGQTASLSDCGLNENAGPHIQAVAMVITILSPSFDAFLGVGEVNDLTTTMSNVALNYTRGQGLSTMYVVPQDVVNTIYFAMPTGLSAQLIFDVVGYFVTSDATALQCTTATSVPSTIPASGGTGSAISPSCAVSYTLTSGSCDSDSFAMNLVSDKASGQAWFCSAMNSGGSDAHLTATVNCCRVPGK